MLPITAGIPPHRVDNPKGPPRAFTDSRPTRRKATARQSPYSRLRPRRASLRLRWSSLVRPSRRPTAPTGVDSQSSGDASDSAASGAANTSPAPAASSPYGSASVSSAAGSGQSGTPKLYERLLSFRDSAFSTPASSANDANAAPASPNPATEQSAKRPAPHRHLDQPAALRLAAAGQPSCGEHHGQRRPVGAADLAAGCTRRPVGRPRAAKRADRRTSRRLRRGPRR